MGYGPYKQGSGCLFPMPFNALTIWVNEESGHVHHVPRLIDRAYPYLCERIVPGASPLRSVRGIPAQDLVAVLMPPAGSERPILALDVENNNGVFPGQQRRDNKAYALPGTCRGQRDNVFFPVVTELVLVSVFWIHPAANVNAPAFLPLLR